MSDVRLREVRPDDLPHFFDHQNDPVAVHMAAFTAPDPADRAAFDAHWANLLADGSVLPRTVVAGGEVAGFVVSFVLDVHREVGYWIGRAHWGQGIATQALAAFLQIERTRPLYAHTAADNIASQRVLQKCGFEPFDRGRGFAYGRGQQIEELIWRLPG